MRDSIRQLLPPLLIVSIVVSLWALADAQRPAADRFQITWRDLEGKLKTGNPYSRDLPTWPPKGFFEAIDAEDAAKSEDPADADPQFTSIDSSELDAIAE